MSVFDKTFRVFTRNQAANLIEKNEAAAKKKTKKNLYYFTALDMWNEQIGDEGWENVYNSLFSEQDNTLSLQGNQQEAEEIGEYLTLFKGMATQEDINTVNNDSVEGSYANFLNSLQFSESYQILKQNLPSILQQVALVDSRGKSFTTEKVNRKVQKFCENCVQYIINYLQQQDTNNYYIDTNNDEYQITLDLIHPENNDKIINGAIVKKVKQVFTDVKKDILKKEYKDKIAKELKRLELMPNQFTEADSIYTHRLGRSTYTAVNRRRVQGHPLQVSRLSRNSYVQMSDEVTEFIQSFTTNSTSYFDRFLKLISGKTFSIHSVNDLNKIIMYDYRTNTSHLEKRYGNFFYMAKDGKGNAENSKDIGTFTYASLNSKVPVVDVYRQWVDVLYSLAGMGEFLWFEKNLGRLVDYIIINDKNKSLDANGRVYVISVKALLQNMIGRSFHEKGQWNVSPYKMGFGVNRNASQINMLNIQNLLYS